MTCLLYMGSNGEKKRVNVEAVSPSLVYIWIQQQLYIVCQYLVKINRDIVFIVIKQKAVSVIRMWAVMTTGTL